MRKLRSMDNGGNWMERVDMSFSQLPQDDVDHQILLNSELRLGHDYIYIVFTHDWMMMDVYLGLLIFRWSCHVLSRPKSNHESPIVRRWFT